MLRHALAALLLLAPLLAPMLASATPPSDIQVDHLLEVMRAKRTVEAMVPQVQAMQRQMAEQFTAGQPLTPGQREAFDRVLYRSNAQILARVSWNNMQPLYRDIYRRSFSAEDMDAMVDFYGSQAGQTLLDRMPQLMQHTMTAMQQVMAPMLQQMQRDIEQAVALAGDGAAGTSIAAPTGSQ